MCLPRRSAVVTAPSPDSMLSNRAFQRYLDQPWLPIGLPALVSLVFLAWVGFGARFSGVRVQGPGALEGADGLGSAEMPEGYLDERVSWGEVRVGERFEGQSVLAQAGRDVLEGSPIGPLRVVAGRAGFNLYRGDHRIYGPNIAGVGPHGVRGTGALAVWFPSDQSRVGVRLVRANGGTATLTFYLRNGTRLDRVVLSSVENRWYALERGAGQRDMAGFTLENDDPVNGLGLAEIRFDAVEPTIAVGDPGRVLVFPTTVLASGAPSGDASGLAKPLAESLAWLNPELIVTTTDTGGELDGASARALASSRGAGIFVTGDARRSDGVVRARAALFGPETGGQALAVAEATGPDEAAAAEALARRLSAALAKQDGRLMEAEAIDGLASLATIRSLLTAREALRAGTADEAWRRLEGITDAAATHASVEYTRSQIAWLEGRVDQARLAAGRAVELSATPGSRRRAGAWSDLVWGRGVSAVRGFRDLVGDEDDADAWFGLVEGLTSLPGLPGSTRSEVLAATSAGLRADPDHLGLVAHLVRFTLAGRHPEYIDFWAKRARPRLSPRPTPISLELDLLVAAFRRDEATFGALAADPLLLDPTVRLRMAVSLAAWAERPDLALDLLRDLPLDTPGDEAAALRMVLDRAMGHGVEDLLSCLPPRPDDVGPRPLRPQRDTICTPSSTADRVRRELPRTGSARDLIQAAVTFEAGGDLASARRALDGIRGPDPAALPWLPLRRLHLAVLAELEGDAAEAIRNYELFRTSWAHADPAGREVLAYARERIAWLGGPESGRPR